MSMTSSSVDLPDEIIELILSKLPKNPNKFLVRAAAGLHLMILEDGKFQAHPVLGYPCRFFIPHSSCNGLILLLRNSRERVMLWNPLLRKHFIVPAFKPHADICFQHLFHDSLTDDYKILACRASNTYMVYSCNKGSWGEEKDVPKHYYLPRMRGTGAVVVDGCLYSITYNDDEIVSFDARDGKQRTLPRPKEARGQLQLTAVSGRLCLHRFSNRSFQLWVMEENKNGGECWRKLISMKKDEPRLGRLTPVCLNNEDVVLWSNGPLPLSATSGYLYYSNYRFQEIHLPWKYSEDYLPYSENLYMGWDMI